MTPHDKAHLAPVSYALLREQFAREKEAQDMSPTPDPEEMLLARLRGDAPTFIPVLAEPEPVEVAERPLSQWEQWEMTGIGYLCILAGLLALTLVVMGFLREVFVAFGRSTGWLPAGMGF